MGGLEKKEDLHVVLLQLVSCPIVDTRDVFDLDSDIKISIKKS